ncbi:hypothetical protein ACFL00_01945, partial [Pseudomonadota bacterium]
LASMQTAACLKPSWADWPQAEPGRWCLPKCRNRIVQPAASLPMLALEHGAAVIEINPRETPLSPHAHQCLRGPASEVLASLVAQLSAWKYDADQGTRL